MSARILAGLIGLTVFAGYANADGAAPAWQTPGYVMEEVIVTAPAPSDQAPAWQVDGYVMEEVVVTASRSELDAARTALARSTELRLALEDGLADESGSTTELRDL